MERIETMFAEILKTSQLSAVRSKMLYSVEDVAFLTGFSADTIYTWIRKGRTPGRGRKPVYLRVTDGLVDRGYRIAPDELTDFLSHFPAARA